MSEPEEGRGGPLIAVFGSGRAPAEDLDRARALGAALAAAGYRVLNGGYGGTMEASAAGAREAGGAAVGVTCAQFTFRAGPNPHLQEVVEAATLVERLGMLVQQAAGYVVLPGGVGTLAELATAWEHLRKGLHAGRPLVVWREPWRRVVAALEGTPYVPGGEKGIVWVDDVASAVRAIRAAVPVEGG